MHLITGYAGFEHITSANDGAYNSHVFGTGKYVFDSRSNFEANVISNNAITIGDGEGIINGRYFEIPKGATETAVIENGTTSSVNRIDLIVARYELNEDTGIETMTLTVIKGEDSSGTPTAPDYYDGSILEGNGFADLPLYKVHINGINIGDVDKLFETIKDVPTELDAIKGNLTELDNDLGKQLRYPNYSDVKVPKTGTTSTVTINNIAYDGWIIGQLTNGGVIKINDVVVCANNMATSSVFVQIVSQIPFKKGDNITISGTSSYAAYYTIYGTI